MADPSTPTPCISLAEVVLDRGAHFKLAIGQLSFAAGAIHAVVGPNGSGKTSLLRLVGLLDSPTGGRIEFAGEAAQVGRGDATRQRRRMGFVMQDPYMLRGTVLDNVAYGLKLRGVGRAEARERVGACLARLGLEGFEARKAGALSGGEAKRVALARALVLEPEVLLLDEPTANVDRGQVRRVEDEIRRAQQERGATVILTTHDLDQARRLTDSITSLVSGRIVPAPPDNVFHCDVVLDERGASATLPNGPTIALVADAAGPAHLAIHPSDIILSREPFDSSARNCLPARVARVTHDHGGVRVDADAGVVFHVQITPASCEEMGIRPGAEVYLTFKASSVHVL